MLRDKKFRNALIFFLAALAIYFFLPGGEAESPVPAGESVEELVTAVPQTVAPETAPPEDDGEVDVPSGLPLDKPDPARPVDEDKSYDNKQDVALYIQYYGHLPYNYITKKEAEKLGWTGGSLEPYAPGKCIGGSRFGNYEGLLPEAEGRSYTECDIDTLGASSRGAKRIVFSNDGLIYYTDDHYESFELLYGEP